MEHKTGYIKNWVLIGSICGLLAMVIYSFMIFVELPLKTTVFLAAFFGPLLIVAFVGLYHLLLIPVKKVSSLLGAVFSVAGALAVSLMLLVQLSVRMGAREYMENAGVAIIEKIQWISRVVDQVQLGLDVSWDVFISLGTILFGLAMFRHPRFGKLMGIAGILIGFLLLFSNLIAFPHPPDAAGYFDFGPVMGLWYVVVAILSLRSLRWIETQQLSENL